MTYVLVGILGVVSLVSLGVSLAIGYLLNRIGRDLDDLRGDIGSHKKVVDSAYKHLRERVDAVEVKMFSEYSEPRSDGAYKLPFGWTKDWQETEFGSCLFFRLFGESMGFWFPEGGWARVTDKVYDGKSPDSCMVAGEDDAFGFVKDEVARLGVPSTPDTLTSPDAKISGYIILDKDTPVYPPRVYPTRSEAFAQAEVSEFVCPVYFGTGIRKVKD